MAVSDTSWNPSRCLNPSMTDLSLHARNLCRPCFTKSTYEQAVFLCNAPTTKLISLQKIQVYFIQGLGFMKTKTSVEQKHTSGKSLVHVFRRLPKNMPCKATHEIMLTCCKATHEIMLTCPSPINGSVRQRHADMHKQDQTTLFNMLVAQVFLCNEPKTCPMLLYQENCSKNMYRKPFTS